MAEQHQHDRKLSGGDIALFGGLGVGGAVIAAPYLLPAIGVGTEHVSRMLNICSEGAGVFGNGLAGTINQGFAQFGDVGTALAGGGWVNAITSGVIGLGGVMLGNYIEKHYDKEGQIPWGKIIKYAAITTSVLIALPSILSAVSMGVTFLTLTFGGASAGAMGTAVGGFMSNTLGYMGGMQALNASAGLAGLLPHLVTCVLGTLPVVGTAILAKNTGNHNEKPKNQLEQVDFRQRLRDVHEVAVSS